MNTQNGFEESIELVKGVTSGHKMVVLDRRICHPRKKRSGEKRMEHGVENIELGGTVCTL
jgi:hypothetical protein